MPLKGDRLTGMQSPDLGWPSSLENVYYFKPKLRVVEEPVLSVPWEERHPAIPGTEEQWRRIGAAARRLGEPIDDNWIIGY